MTYDPYDPERKQERPAKTRDAADTGKGTGSGAADDERALRSERGSKPATPVVPLSESETAAAAVGDTGHRPAPPATAPMTPPVTPPAAPPKTARATEKEPTTERATKAEKDPLAGPVQDPVHPVHTPDSKPGSARTAAPSASSTSATPSTSAAPSTSATPEPARATAPGRTPEATPEQTPRLIPQDECDKLNLRLQEALSTFVDGPRRSVEEAAEVLEEAVKRLRTALAERPRTLRESWDGGHGDKSGGSGKSTPDTEDLRLALRNYREVTERLLRI